MLHTGKDADLVGGQRIYQTFRREFPRADFADLMSLAAQWKKYGAVYGLMLDPRCEDDREIRCHLGYANTFGRAMYPLLMGLYSDYRDGNLDKTTLVETMQQMETLYLRKVLVGESRDHLAAQLCRRWPESTDLIRDIARKCPSDERIRTALTYRPLPHPGYVLGRLNNGSSVNSVLGPCPHSLDRGSVHPTPSSQCQTAQQQCPAE